MADKSSQLTLDALGRALANPGGAPLYGNKKVPGLFAAHTAARQAAQRCKDAGYLRVVDTNTSGKSVQEICAITEKGLAYLLGEVSPKRVLEDLVHALEARQTQVGELVAVARQWQQGLDALQATVHRVLQEVQKAGNANHSTLPCPELVAAGNGSEPWTAQVIAYLSQWQSAGKSSDCPLPDLCRRAQQLETKLTIGRFHDGLRRLHEQAKIYLHPWTGPLYELPEPSYALMIGHEIVYYASLR